MDLRSSCKNDFEDDGDEDLADADKEETTEQEKEKEKEEKTKEKEEKEKEEARAGKVVRMDLRLTGRQTRHRKKVVRIQPATTYMQHDVEYKVWV